MSEYNVIKVMPNIITLYSKIKRKEDCTMYNKKHMAVQKSKIKYILIIALIIIIFLIIKSVYNIQVTTIKNVDKATYFSFEEDLNKTGNVIIKYVNSEGNEIAESQTITGKV